MIHSCMRYLAIIGLTFFFGCQEPKTKPLMQSLPPENSLSYPVAIEINSVPFPFDLNGHYPYVVWMNGKRVELPKEDLITLVNKVGKENIPLADTKDIHKGWLSPYFAETEADTFLNQRSRSRILKP